MCNHKDCMNCGNAIYVEEGDYVCISHCKIVITRYNEPTEEFMICEGEDWSEND